MSGKNDLAGRSFGDLVCVEATDEVDRKRSIVWNCKCVCGRVVLRSRNALLYANGYECQHVEPKLRGGAYVEHAERQRVDGKER